MNWSPVGVVGHRGASSVAPENTLASFQAARSLGASGIEFDVHQSVDGELVVVHDFVVDRTTDGSGEILDLSWPMLSDLDAGSWFGRDFTGEPVPTLRQVLALDALDFELELKGSGERFLRDVLVTVDESGVGARVKFTGGNIPLLAEVKRRRPEVLVGLFSRPREAWMSDQMFEQLVVGTAEFAVADVVHVRADWLTSRIVERLHGQGRMVQANDAISSEIVERAVSFGADHVSANDVAMAVSAVEKAKDQLR